MRQSTLRARNGGISDSATYSGGNLPPPHHFPQVPGALDNALALVEYLRAHCSWDREQTASSLVPHLIEETQETVEAIHAGDPSGLREELGDLLLNLAFQVVVAEEAGHFTRQDLVRELQEKMVRRHPHLFGGERDSWEAIKARERSEDHAVTVPGHGAPSAVDGLAQGLDPLLRAHRIQERVSRVGFDWDEPEGALAKVKEELAEVELELRAGRRDTLAGELGDLLFAVVNLTRLSGAHAVPALLSANVKFERRFRAVEALANERGLSMPGASLAQLDALWDEVKTGEAASRDGGVPGAATGHGKRRGTR